jgi:hypothetical protein
LQEKSAKRCEKQLTHPRLLAAGVSKDADFRLLDTHANPPQWDSPKNSCGFIESLFATTSNYILSIFVSQPTNQLVTFGKRR